MSKLILLENKGRGTANIFLFIAIMDEERDDEMIDNEGIDSGNDDDSDSDDDEEDEQ